MTTLNTPFFFQLFATLTHYWSDIPKTKTIVKVQILEK